jgi:hypothetical protein
MPAISTEFEARASAGPGAVVVGYSIGVAFASLYFKNPALWKFGVDVEPKCIWDFFEFTTTYIDPNRIFKFKRNTFTVLHIGNHFAFRVI